LRENSQFLDSRLIECGSASVNDGDELAFVSAIMAFQPGSCPHPDLLKQTHEFCSFTGPQYGHGFLHVNRVLLEGSLDQVSARVGELNDPRAEVSGVGSPPDQLP
jgi:hypothetical protein